LGDLPVGLSCRTYCLHIVLASEAKQSIVRRAETWIASRSLSSGARSRGPLARNDGLRSYNAARITTFASHR